MADVKLVRGTLRGAKVETTEENAERLGSDFTPEIKAPPKKAAASSKSSK